MLAVAGVKTVHSGCCPSAPQKLGEEQPVARVNCLNDGSPLPKAALLQALLPMCSNAVRYIPLTWQETTVVPLPAECVFPSMPLPKKQECLRGLLPQQFLQPTVYSKGHHKSLSKEKTV